MKYLVVIGAILFASPAMARGAPTVVHYRAPAHCPSPRSVQQALGEHYDVRGSDGTGQATIAQYRIEIEPAGNAQHPTLVLTIAGLDAARVQNSHCATLVELGVHTIRASAVDTTHPAATDSEAADSVTTDAQLRRGDLEDSNPARRRAVDVDDAPVVDDFGSERDTRWDAADNPRAPNDSAAPSFELGLNAATVVDPVTVDGFSLLGAQAAKQFGPVNLVGSAGWVVPMRLVSTLQTENNGLLTVTGWSAGTDVCWVNGSALQLCALAVVRNLSVEPREDFETTATGRMLLGLGASWASRVSGPLQLQAQPAVLVSTLGRQQVRWTGLDREIYEYPAVEVQLRASVAWAFGRKRQ